MPSVFIKSRRKVLAKYEIKEMKRDVVDYNHVAFEIAQVA